MNRRILATVFLLATIGLALPVAASEKLGDRIDNRSMLLAQSNWQTFTSEAGKFKIALPRKPSPESIQPAEFAGEPINLYQISTQNPNGAYLVAYTDLPPNSAQKDPEKVLDEISSQLLAQMTLQTLKGSEKKIELNGNPGREFRTSIAGKIVAMRLYLVGQRSYLLLTRSRDSGDTNQFLSSFQLL
jgi:hypothetical protein